MTEEQPAVTDEYMEDLMASAALRAQHMLTELTNDLVTDWLLNGVPPDITHDMWLARERERWAFRHQARPRSQRSSHNWLGRWRH